MTEWDKMQEHQIYNDFDADLFNLRVKAKKLFKEFNRTEDEEVERRQEIMHKLFKKVGCLRSLTALKMKKLNDVRKSCTNSSRK